MILLCLALGHGKRQTWNHPGEEVPFVKAPMRSTKLQPIQALWLRKMSLTSNGAVSTMTDASRFSAFRTSLLIS